MTGKKYTEKDAAKMAEKRLKINGIKTFHTKEQPSVFARQASWATRQLGI